MTFRIGRFLTAAAAAALIAGAAAPQAYAQAPRLMAPPLAADGTLSFADLVERVSPAVVSVMVEKEVEAPRLPGDLEQFFQFRFGAPDNDNNGGGDDSFGDDGGMRHMQAEGSGFFIDNKGHIVTNNHVVEDADTVSVRLSDGRELKATIVGRDELTDLAVLKVDADKNQPFVNFAEDVNLRVGDWVLAVGNPYGLSGTVTSGIVSAIGGQNRQNQYLDFIQVDAPINRGNSGGPTFDLKGRVVGVNTAIYSPNGGSVGIGFAIPARVAKQTVDQLIASGSVTRGWLGIGLQEVTTEIAAALNLKDRTGVLVRDVIEGTPAQKSGLESGDVILSIDNAEVDNPNTLSRLVAALPPGRKIQVKVLRDGKPRTLNVTLGERSADEQTAAAEEPSAANDDDSLAKDVGLRVSSLTDELRQQLHLPDSVKGVLVTGVKPESSAEAAGLGKGVVILQVDGADVTSPNDLRDKIASAKKSGKDAVLVRMQIGQNRQFGALSLNDDH